MKTLEDVRRPVSAEAQALGLSFCCGRDEDRANEIAKLRNVVQAGILSAGREDIIRSWNYHFPEKPLK